MPKIDVNKKRGYKASAPVEKIWGNIESGAMDGSLCVPLGEDVKKRDIYLNLKTGLHILAAGEALSGVGMFRRVTLATLLKFNNADDLKFILIDSLHISFFDFKNIDERLVLPIVTQNDKAIEAFEWLNKEMSQRYETLKISKYRTIDDYNKNNSSKKMPHIVLILTELGELIDYDKKAYELILRILQMSKCVGIHLILTTQWLSRNTIRATILANTPTKIVFKSGSKEGSAAILSRPGAEELLGQGDMIVESNCWLGSKRLQGYYIAEEVISKTVF